MSAESQNESVSSPDKQNTNKYALKLLGLDFGTLTDEDILEFISEHVQPSAIKGLFYDSFNSFYVLHLSDIESTRHLIGKTLMIGTYSVNFLPLLDCFVIGNVYLSLSNAQLREIFSVFGNVFEIKSCHVLPNSSKFFHVLSGTREISFLLPGMDSEVSIPVTVMHPPYTFHVKHLCLRCHARGHSLMNCTEKLEIAKDKEQVAKDNFEKNVIINIVPQEMTFEVSQDNHGNDKPAENVALDVTNIKENIAIKEEVSENNGELPKKKKIPTKNFQGVMYKRKTVPYVKNKTKLKRILSVSRKKKSSASENSETDLEHTSNLPKINSLDLPPSVKNCIMRSKGVISNIALIELMYLDARNRRNILQFVLDITPDIRAVLSQLRTLQNDLLQEVDKLKVPGQKTLNTVEAKVRQKIWSIVRVLKKYLVS